MVILGYFKFDYIRPVWRYAHPILKSNQSNDRSAGWPMESTAGHIGVHWPACYSCL